MILDTLYKLGTNATTEKKIKKHFDNGASCNLSI